MKQCIIGDGTDNIKGVAKLGEKKTQGLFQPYLDRFKQGEFNGSKALLREALFNEVVLPLYQAQHGELPKTNALKPLAFSYGDTRRNAFRR
ncbi:hypothetical protein KVL38_03475 [Helicobacter pylori]|nr:hypothetical protein KVL38_03475 [Helicobacter pylori]